MVSVCQIRARSSHQGRQPRPRVGHTTRQGKPTFVRRAEGWHSSGSSCSWTASRRSPSRGSADGGDPQGLGRDVAPDVDLDASGGRIPSELESRCARTSVKNASSQVSRMSAGTPLTISAACHRCRGSRGAGFADPALGRGRATSYSSTVARDSRATTTSASSLRGGDNGEPACRRGTASRHQKGPLTSTYARRIGRGPQRVLSSGRNS